MIGFEEGSTSQTAQVCEGLGWIMCIGVILAIGGGLLISSRIKMTRAEVQQAMDILESRVNETSGVQTAETAETGTRSE